MRLTICTSDHRVHIRRNLYLLSYILNETGAVRSGSTLFAQIYFSYIEVLENIWKIRYPPFPWCLYSLGNARYLLLEVPIVWFTVCFSFSPIVNFPFLSSNIPTPPAYGVYVSQLIRYARTCSNYQDFMERGKVLTTKLLSQGYQYQTTKLVATLKKFYGRHHGLVNPYNVAVFRIVSDVFASDAP